MSDSLIVSAVSDLVIEIMNGSEPEFFANPGLTPLTDGRVLLGRHHVAERSTPSRVIFVPMNSAFGPPGLNSQTVVVNNRAPGFQQRLRQRTLGTDISRYLVYCWGQSVRNDREHDFDVTRWLAHVVMRACQRLMMTSVSFFPGEGWTDQRSDGPSLLSAGHEFCFGVQIEIPIPDSSVELVTDDPRLPNGLTLNPTLTFKTGG